MIYLCTYAKHRKCDKNISKYRLIFNAEWHISDTNHTDKSYIIMYEFNDLRFILG